MMVTSKQCVKATCTFSKTKEAVSWQTPSYMVYKFTCPVSVENKYGWGEKEVATFMFSNRLVYWVGLWAGVPLLSRKFQLSDNIIAIIASITTTAGAELPYLTLAARPLQNFKYLSMTISILQDCSFLYLLTQLSG